MEIAAYDSFNKKVVELELDRSKPVRWYSCGPTVYDSAHLGHARTFIVFDVIRRILEYNGYTSIYAMNITDIDDKIIKKVQELNCMDSYKEFTQKMENEFWEDMDSLNVMRPTIVTRVTECIDDIIK